MSDWRSDPNGFNEAVISEFRANGGVVGGELADMPLLLLTTIDARSGRPRTTPLAYHRRGNRYLVIASNGGAARNPAWFRNLERDPDVTVEVGVGTLAATARILNGSERDAAFAAIVAEAPSAGEFQAKAGRTIPVIELEPQRDAVVTAGPTEPRVQSYRVRSRVPARDMRAQSGACAPLPTQARQTLSHGADLSVRAIPNGRSLFWKRDTGERLACSSALTAPLAVSATLTTSCERGGHRFRLRRGVIPRSDDFDRGGQRCGSRARCSS